MPGETILVVEDESSVRALLVRLLSTFGYRILQASSGVGALQVWNEHKAEIDLLFTDMVMPDEPGGLDLASSLLAEKASLKIVLTSGYSARLAARGEALDHRFHFLQKPYEPRRLAAFLRECLDQPAAEAVSTPRSGASEATAEEGEGTA
jgi:DNA-binding NtrC family response regulator